jgi:hypothetical protein
MTSLALVASEAFQTGIELTVPCPLVYIAFKAIDESEMEESTFYVRR